MKDDLSATEAVHALFLEHSAALRGFIYGLLGDREAAKDVFQEVFLTVTRQAGQYRRQCSFLAWARGIARNKVLEHYRSRRRTPMPFDEGLIELLAESVREEHDHWAERRAALAECIRQLAPRARQILEMRYAEEPAAPTEIARRLSWTVNAVNVALSRARRFLEDCTRRRLEDERG